MISIAAVSAADDAASDTIISDTNENIILEESNDNALDSQSDTIISDTNDDSILEESNANALDSGSEEQIANINKEILSAPNDKNFTELNRTINGNSNATIYLNDDYTFDSSYDSELICGIAIERTVTIEGNNHTINGNKEARIFQMHGDNIILKNINFINAYADESFTYAGDYGGAIYGRDTVFAINCTFTDNTAGRGAAMYQGDAINCTFIGNNATEGGAMYSGNAINCTFIDNTATNGTAMYEGAAVICNRLEGNAYDKTTIITPNVTVDTIIFYPNTPEKLTFNITCELDGTIYKFDDYNTTINISQNGNSLGTYYCLSGEDGGLIVDRDYGLYNLTFFVKNNPLNPVITIRVPEDSSFAALSKIIKDNNGNEITLNRSYTYNQTYDYDLKDGIIIDHAVTINGKNHTIDGFYEARIFNIIGSDVIINNITFIRGYVKIKDILDTNGYKGCGGAICCIGDRCTIKNSKFINNTAVYGGAVYMKSNNSSISYSEFYNNTVMTNTQSHLGGGAVNWYGHNGNISHSIFTDNHAIGYGAEGGAIRWYTSHNGTITDSNFTNNTSNYIGGAILWMGGNGTIKNSNFTNNNANSTGYGAGCAGGGVYVASYSNTTIKDSNFTNNSAKDGGAIGWYESTEGTISNITFIDNKADEDGGAIRWTHSNYGTICNSTFTNNNAGDEGGAIYCDPNNDVTLANSTFTNNSAKDGGAVQWTNNRNSAAYNLTFTNNTAINGSAIHWFSYSGYLRNSTFINNNATNGGALWYASSHNSNITNLTFINNTAPQGASIYA